MFSIRAIVNHLIMMRGYFAFSTILFLAGIVVGGSNPALEQFVSGQLAGIQEIGRTIDSSSNPTLLMFGFIFLNNAIKSIVVMYFGILFGVVPILFVIINGMVIGFLFKLVAEQQGIGVLTELIFKGIVPHGIIEIPAILLACAYGLKFGALTFRSIGVLFKKDKSLFRSEYENFVLRTIPVMVILAVSLLIAAIIESTITVWLLEM